MDKLKIPIPSLDKLNFDENYIESDSANEEEKVEIEEHDDIDSSEEVIEILMPMEEDEVSHSDESCNEDEKTDEILMEGI